MQVSFLSYNCQVSTVCQGLNKKIMTKEQKFYNIPHNLFVGGKLEGNSRYVNLMNIKTDYFNLIKRKIEDKIKQKFGEENPEDLYNKLNPKNTA